MDNLHYRLLSIDQFQIKIGKKVRQICIRFLDIGYIIYGILYSNVKFCYLNIHHPMHGGGGAHRVSLQDQGKKSVGIYSSWRTN